MYERILVPVDGSATSNRGLDEAVKLARLTGATLRLVHSVEQLMYAPGLSADVAPLIRAQGEQILNDAKARVEAGQVQVEAKLFETRNLRLAEMVIGEARAWAADLIVMGTHGRRGLNRLMLGSDAEQVARLAGTPILLVRGADASPG